MILSSSPTKLTTSNGTSPVKLETSSPLKRSSPPLDVKLDVEAFRPLTAIEPDEEEEDDDILTHEDSDEDQNPFEAFAMSQASQGNHQIKVEVDENSVMRGRTEAIDEAFEDMDEEQLHQMMHERDAKQRAEESAKLHATQASQRSYGTEEFADEELDELFRTTVGDTWVGWDTPKRRGMNGSVTPSTASRTADSTPGGLDSRRTMRDRRMREMAGLGDLSTIMDRSSVTLSSPSRTPVPQTPTRNKPNGSTKNTLAPIARNLFAKNRPIQSPIMTPKARMNGITPSRTIVLAESKRSLAEMSPSPDEDEQSTPTKSKLNRGAQSPPPDVKPDVFSRKHPRIRNVDVPLPPARQPPSVRSTETINDTEEVRKSRKKRVRLPSPTLHNTQPDSTGSATTLENADETPKQKKRVRLASPESGLQPTPLKVAASTSQSTPNASVETKTSSTDSEATCAAPFTTSDSTVRSETVTTAWQFHLKAPTVRQVSETVFPEVIYQEPYYSTPQDVPSRPKMFAGRMFALKSNGASDLPDFESSHPATSTWLKTRHEHLVTARYGWEYAPPAPTLREVIKTCDHEDAEIREAIQRRLALTSQLRRPTQKSKFGFKFSQRKKTKDSEREHQNMSVLAVEVFGELCAHAFVTDVQLHLATSFFLTLKRTRLWLYFTAIRTKTTRYQTRPLIQGIMLDMSSWNRPKLGKVASSWTRSLVIL